jgi:hypothetical protein
MRVATQSNLLHPWIFLELYYFIKKNYYAKLKKKKKKTSSRYSGYTSRSTFMNLSTRASNVPIEDLISSHQTVEAGVPLQSQVAM